MASVLRAFVCGSMLAASVGLVACGGGESSGTPLADDGGADASALDASMPDDSGSDDSGFSIGCKPPCVDPQFCSVANVCIDKGTCAVDGDCTSGMKCDASKKCVPGGDCGAQKAVATAVAPNMLITLDRSCSMTGALGASTKWAVAVGAIKSMMTKYGGKVRFGLTLFPDTDADACRQGPIPFEPAPDNEPKISTALTNALVKTDPLFPDGPCVTNIDTGLQQAAGASAFKDKTRPGYVLLISDGGQAGCSAAGGNAGSEKIIVDLLAAGVKTAVIGFGSGVSAATLDKFATAGGMPATGATKFYKAEDAAGLDAALAAIAGAALGCTYKLDKTPADPTKIFVFFDGTKEVASDPANGWTYDPATNTVTFHGTTCNDLKTDKVKSVDIVLGCKSTPA